VRSAAEVLPDRLPRFRVDVVVDREFGATDLDRLVVAALGRPALDADQFELVRLVCQLGAGLVVGHDPAHEALAVADDPVHGLLERLDVLRREGLLHVEVVVEPVGHGRADAEARGRVHGLHGLRENMRRGVPKNAEPVGRRDGDRQDLIRGSHRRGEVPELTVDAHCDNGPVGEKLKAVNHVYDSLNLRTLQL